MKKVFCWLWVCCLLTGCGVMLEELQPSDMKPAAMTAMPDMKRRFVSLQQVRIGMSRTEVKSLLALPVVVGYELIDREGRQYKPLTMINPHRAEVIRQGSKAYEVDYYLVGICRQDDMVSDEELMPLIYFNDKVVALGWEAVTRLRT